VGADQLPHIELTRTIARRFNDRYSPGHGYFPEPEGLLSHAPLILGVNGAKMSKSRANAIMLGASEDDTARLISAAKTDAERRITYEPARRPEVSNLVLLAALCLERSPESVAEEVGGAGAAGLKRLLTDALNERLRPIRERRRELAADPGYLSSVLRTGTHRAREIASATLADVRELMHNAY
jgi:tryptophanyl-tRNA synthetase